MFKRTALRGVGRSYLRGVGRSCVDLQALALAKETAPARCAGASSDATFLPYRKCAAVIRPRVGHKRAGRRAELIVSTKGGVGPAPSSSAVIVRSIVISAIAVARTGRVCICRRNGAPATTAPPTAAPASPGPKSPKKRPQRGRARAVT
jgi:hypothetical protein